MGSDDDTYTADSVLAVQDPKGSSAAKTTSSDGNGGADGSGASSPSSRRHQEQVQNLKDKCEGMGVPMRPVDNFVDETKAPVRGPDITSVASRSSRAPTPSDNSSSGDGSGAPCSWLLTQEEHVRYLKNNCRRAFCFWDSETEWAAIEDDPWFARVVAKLRADSCLDNSELEIEKQPFRLWGARPLHFAVLMGDLEMVQKILETRLGPNEVHIDSLITGLWAPYSALDLAIIGEESEIVDALLEKNAKVNTGRIGSLQLAVAHARAGQTENTFKIIQSLVRTEGIDVKAKDFWGYSAFYLAVAKGKTDIVNELLKWKDNIQLNEACKGGRPPIQIAHEEGFKDIEGALMKCDDVKRYIESAFRDRQAYVDAANAILVGAALIASVTFASWLQPPLNYTTPYDGSSVEYVDVEHISVLGLFWVFNTLSFYFAIATVVFGAHSVLPRRQLFITENVKKLSQNLLLTSILLAFSVFFIIIAFGIAGVIVLIPILRYRWYMIAPTMLGGIVCVGSIGYLLKNVWENSPWNIRKRDASDLNLIDIRYGFPKDAIGEDIWCIL